MFLFFFLFLISLKEAEKAFNNLFFFSRRRSYKKNTVEDASDFTYMLIVIVTFSYKTVLKRFYISLRLN